MDWDWTMGIEDLPLLTGSSRKQSRFFDISSQDLDEDAACSSNNSSQSNSQEPVGSNSNGACSSSLSSKWNRNSVELISPPFQNLHLKSENSQSGLVQQENPIQLFYPSEFQNQKQVQNGVNKYQNHFGVIQQFSTTTITTKGAEQNEEKKKKNIPQILISPRSLYPCMGAEAVYFVHEETGKPLPPLECFYVAVIHPGPGSFVQYRKLGRDTSTSTMSRYFFSFVPRFPGEHVIILKLLLDSGISRISGENNIEMMEVAQVSQKVLVSRNYPVVKQESFNHIRLGFESKNGGFLSKGWGVAIHHQTNNVYLAERNSDRIVVLDSTGKVLNRFGQYGHHDPGQLWRPTGICVDEVNGRVIITDKDHHRVSIFSLEGDYIFSFGSGGHREGEFNYPWGVDVSKDGELIAVADSRNHRIQVFDKNGIFLRKFSVFEVRPFDFKEEFYYPRGICFDNSDENLYVTDFNIHAVFKLDVGLTSKSTIIRDVQLLHRPQGIAMDPAGNLLICETHINCIRVHKSSGDFICSLEGSGRDPFYSPMDVAVFKDGKIAVVDEPGRFRVF